MAKFTLDVPTMMHLPAHFPLGEILAEKLRQQLPDHLRSWQDVLDQRHQDGLRHSRFGNIFRMAFYRDAVMASRYGERLPGRVEIIDEIFGDFLGVGGDSVKKLRLKMAKLRMA
jgi:hypothetical protein